MIIAPDGVPGIEKSPPAPSLARRGGRGVGDPLPGV